MTTKGFILPLGFHVLKIRLNLLGHSYFLYSWSSHSVSMQSTDTLSTKAITFLIYEDLCCMFSQSNFQCKVQNSVVPQKSIFPFSKYLTVHLQIISCNVLELYLQYTVR